MASAIDELRKRVYGNTEGANAAPSVSANNQSSMSRLQDIVYRGAPYTVKQPVQKPIPTPVVTENNEPTLGERLTNILTGSIKSTGSQYANTLGTTQAVTGGVMRENYLTRDIEQLEKELLNYRAKAKSATDIEEQKYFLLEAGKTANALDEAKANLAQTATAGQTMQRKADELAASSAKDIAAAKQGLNALQQAAVDVGVAGTQLAGDLALGALTGTGALAMGLRSAGGAAQEARQSGATLGDQVAYGVGSGVLSAATERLSNAATPLKKVFGAGVLDNAVTKAAGKLGQTAAGKIALSAISEGSEEFAEALVDPLLKLATYDKDAAWDEEWFADALYSAAIGAALGGVIGGGDVAVSKASQAATSKLQKASETNLPSRAAKTQASEGEGMPLAQKSTQSVAEGVLRASTPSSNFTEERPQGNTIGAAQSGFSPYTAAMNQYGTLPGGENPVRPDDVPASITGKDKVSQTVVTALGAKVTPDEFVPLIENRTMKGGFSFIPITNSETVAKAKARIVEYGWVNALTNWTKALHSGKASPVLAAEGALLYNNAVNSGNYQQAMEILQEYADLERRAARTTQAARIMKTLSPDKRLYMINRDIQKLVDNMDLQNPIKLPDALVKTYMDAKTDAEMNDAVDDIAQYVALQIPSTKLDKWTALRYMNMLGNFKTQVRNISGNALMAATAEASNAVAVLGQKATGGKFGKTRTLTVSKEMREAAKADFDDPSNTTWNEGKYTLRNQNASAFERAVRDKQTVFTGVLSPLESYRKATNWAMNNEYFGDTAWIKAAYARYLGGWLESNGYTAAQLSDPQWRKVNAEVLDQARAFAKKQAEEIAFRDSNWLSDWVSRLGRKNSTPKPVRILSEGLLPFRKTPANVMMRAAEYSPLGLIKSAVDAVRVSRGSDAVTGDAVIEEIAKGLTGTGMLALGMWLASMGLLRGGEDEDEKQAGFDDLVGKQPYSLELGETSLTIDWAAPVAVPMLMGAQLYDLIYENGFQLKDLEKALTGIVDPLISMSMLQGAEDLLTSVKYAEGSSLMQIALSTAVNYLAQGLTNSLAGQTERVLENENTMNYVDKDNILPDWLQKDIGKMSRKMPGVDLFQTAYIDAWGRTEDQEDLGVRAFNALFNPAYVSEVDVDQVEQELQRLYDATGESVFPQRADKSITVGGETIAFSAEQYDKYARRLGQERYRMVKAATSSDAYRRLSDKDKAEVIGKCYSAAKAKTIAEQFTNYALPNNIKGYVDADRKGTDLATYYARKH